MPLEDPSRERGDACDACLRRSWLVARLSAHLDRAGSAAGEALALDDQALLQVVAGGHLTAVRGEYERFQPTRHRGELAERRVGAFCACSERYPPALRSCLDRPAVLYARAGHARAHELLRRGGVAIVGSRRASPYGVEIAAELARSLAASGLTVCSGMASGIDAAAHRGALVGGATVAVLPAGPDHAYPKAHRRLHEQIVEQGLAVSELPPGARVWRWSLALRNRIIAALTDMTVLVEGARGSGALLTVARAYELEQLVGAVPGRVTSPQAWGPNELLARGATVVRGAGDVLNALSLSAPADPGAAASRRRQLDPEGQRLLDALGEERGVEAALASAGLDTAAGLARLAELELEGYVRRRAGGAYEALP